MNLDDLIGKLQQIEHQAALALSEHPERWVRERQRLIGALAHQVRSLLEDERRLQEAKLRAVAAEAQQRPGGPRQQS